MKDDLPWEEKTSQMGFGLGALIHPSAIDLNKHIQTHHNGNTSAFARTQDVSESQARRWLKRNCVVIDGTVYCEVSKQIKGSE